MAKIIHFLETNKDNSKLIYEVLIAGIFLIIFYVMLFIIEYIRHSRGVSFWLINQYSVIALIGAIPVVFKQYCFSSIFLIGALIGWSGACYVAYYRGRIPQ